MGLHREIIINYGKIEDAIGKLGSYLDSLDRIERVIDANSEMLSDQKGKAFAALEEKRLKIKRSIAVQREMATDLRDSLTNYIRDMEDRIHPIVRYGDVRVRRDDIGFNLMNIKSAVEDVFSPKIHLMDETNPYLEIWVSTGDMGSGYYDTNWDKINAERRNGDKIDDFQDYTMSRIKDQVDECLWNLENIHRNHVQEFENTDDRHAQYAKELYAKYSDKDERRKDVRDIYGETMKDFAAGAWDTIKGIGLGLFGLGKVGVSYVVTAASNQFSFEPPEWAPKSIDDFKAGFKDLKSPLDFFKKIGQDFCDTYEERDLHMCREASRLTSRHASSRSARSQKSARSANWQRPLRGW